MRMNHANGVLSGNGPHFHEESGDIRAGNRGVGSANGHFKFFRIAVEEQKERIQSAGGIQVLKLAENTSAVTGLMRKVAVGENEVPARGHARLRIAAALATTRSAAALPLSIESSIEKYSHRPYRPAA